MDAQHKTISLVIPAWNEEAYLPRLLETANKARDIYAGGPDAIEIIVADNGSTDRTAEIADSSGCKVVPVAERCIAAARNGGAHAASGEIVAFADADFRLHRESFNLIDYVMRTGRFVGGGTGLTMERWSLGIAVTWYSIMPPLWLLGLDGGIWYCRRADFESIGGYNEDVRAGEDVRLLMALKKLGRTRNPRQKMATRFIAKKVGAPPAIALNSTRKFDEHGDWHMLRDLLKTAPTFLFNGQAGVDQYIDRYWYQGR